MTMKYVSLKVKLILSLLAISLLPALAQQLNGHWRNQKTEKSVNATMVVTAHNIADKLDRNLFERYGDVQAFGYNLVVEHKDSWYKTGHGDNQIVAAMNNYVAAYGIYSVMIFVDTLGKVIAVNDRDKSGKELNTNFFYEEDFGNAQWFKDALEGRFTTKEGYLSGTVIEDVYGDPHVVRTYGGTGKTIGFSAPVKDSQGNLLGVWKNFADFGLVKDIVRDDIKTLASEGTKSSLIAVVSRGGETLLSMNSSGDTSTNWAAGSAKSWYERAVRGETASGETTLDNEERVIGFAPLVGAMGYAGMNWTVIATATTAEVHAAIDEAFGKARVEGIG